MSNQTRSTYQAQLSSTYFPDNTSEQISEGDVRASLTNLSDSALFKQDDPFLRVEDATTGTQPNYVITLANLYPSSYNGLIPILFKAHATSTGAATLNVNSLGAKDLLRPDGSATQSGDIVIDKWYMVSYDSGLDDFLIFEGFAGGQVFNLNTGGTDNAILRADGTGGSTLQNSAATISDAGAMLVVGTAVTPITGEQTTPSTSSLISSIIAKATSTGNMADGFGSMLRFQIEDDALTTNEIARVGAERAGADNTGDLVFYTASTGTLTERMKLSSSGALSLNTLSGTATQLGGFTSGNVATTVTVGTGLDLTSGTLSVPTATITSGSHTPTTSSLSGLSSTSVESGAYSRIGNSIIYSFRITLNYTGTGAWSFTIDLPVSSNFTSTSDVRGTYMVSGPGISSYGGIFANPTDDDIDIQGTRVSGTSETIYAIVQYLVL